VYSGPVRSGQHAAERLRAPRIQPRLNSRAIHTVTEIRNA
jgi:hypothetical protein